MGNKQTKKKQWGPDWVVISQELGSGDKLKRSTSMSEIQKVSANTVILISVYES